MAHSIGLRGAFIALALFLCLVPALKKVSMSRRCDSACLNGDDMGIYWSSVRPPTNAPKALVFDMDGVLIDSERLHENTKRQALRSAGIEVDETVFARYTGRSDRVMITDVARINGRSTDEIEAILAEKHRLYALGERDLTACGGTDHFPAGVPANGNGVNCMPRGAVGAKVEVV
jgi:hypothetical protein